MTTLQARDLYHTAIIVENVEAAMERLTRIAGYRWMQPIEHPVAVWTSDGESTVGLRMVYSLDEPMLELIQQVPGTTWMPSPGSAIHHIGYFVDDLHEASQALVGQGIPIEVCGCSGPMRPSGFAYHVDSDGLRIEVVHRSVLHQMEQLMTSVPANTASSGR